MSRRPAGRNRLLRVRALLGSALLGAAVACNFPAASTPPAATPFTFATPITPTAAGEQATALPSVTAAPPPPPTDPRAGQVERNLRYCRMGDVDLYLDLYYPHADPPEGRAGWPAVVLIHGGLWLSGDKANDPVLKFAEPLREAGYLLVSVNYRLSPEVTFPAHLQDVRCAVRFLRAHASDYTVDPARISAMGHSAGGHLAALLGTLAANDRYPPTGEYLEQSGRVAAVVDIAGVSDPDIYCSDNVAQQVFGAADCDDEELLAAADPASYITPDDPPFLLIHGDNDRGVALDFSIYLRDHLQAGGVPVILTVVENAGHSFTPGSQPFVPSMSELGDLIVAFLNANMP